VDEDAPGHDEPAAEPPQDDGPPPIPAHLEAAGTSAAPRGRVVVAAVAGGVALALVLGVGSAAAWRAGSDAAAGLASTVWGDPGAELVVVDESDLTRRTDEGCERLAGQRGPEPQEDRTHLDDEEAAELTPDDLYEVRPPHSGRHLGRFLPLPPDAFDAPVDERALVHNLEHGAVAVLYDPSELPQVEVDALEAWVAERNGVGFHDDAERTGAAIVVAPVTPGTIASGRPLALRAWGVATDCDGFDEVVADGFLARHFGTRGSAPEGFLAPYPAGTVELIRPDV
jgi:hypothetical protein